tara:strand:- start:4374 stop:4661 length:288 start_codon:yes stop_codon:yes gene_type:complete
MIGSLPYDLRYIIYGIRLARLIDEHLYYRHRNKPEFKYIFKMFKDHNKKIEDYEMFYKIRWEFRHCADDWIYMLINDPPETLDIILDEAKNGLWS